MFSNELRPYLPKVNLARYPSTFLERAPPPLTLPCPQGAGCESSTPGRVHTRRSAAKSPLHPPDFGLDRPNFAWVRKETLGGGHAAENT